MDYLKYDKGTGDLANWLVSETKFEENYQGKCETIFCLGNGYLGTRSATEESYIGQVRNTFVAGSFNKSDEREVTELPNAADIWGIDIIVDGVRFTLNKGTVSDYHRTFNLKNGLLEREFIWTINSKSIQFKFQRFVSKADLHTLCSSISITPITDSINVSIKSGINGQVSNSGAQHFLEGEKRIFDAEYLQMVQKTTESEIDFIHNVFHDFSKSVVNVDSRFEMDRRKVLMKYEANVEAGSTLVFDKIANIFTSRDKDVSTLSFDELRSHSVDHLKVQSNKGFKQLLVESSDEWANYWDQMDIAIESENPFNQLAIRFAQYHLLVMTPAHDNRMGVAAKGLSGEGYKGHSFWDTEIFILPFFTYTFPEIARSLLEYRFSTLPGAHKKAEDNGYKGAMYPWESAWADDGEVTPVWGAVDIITGKATKIWSGFIEQHITSDVAFGIWQYFKVTNDIEFMRNFGYEILLDTAIFWSSRLEWNEEKQEYHINNVVGPDEYKEHVNNDAFTNHTAYWCMENAINFYQFLKENEPEVFDRLNEKLNLDSNIREIEIRKKKMYVPDSNSDNVIPQDDTYLSLKEIDLTKYKNQKNVGSLFQDFNLEQVNKIQVSKQASVVMLMYLLEHKFSKEVKEANYHYYEPRTLHDSSLSLSTHSILASDIGDSELAYSLFERASKIDLGPNMKTSDHGIHAAAQGGVWQIITCGFGGVRMVNGELLIRPHLPKQIQSIRFPINWHGTKIEIYVTDSEIQITKVYGETINIKVFESEYLLEGNLNIHLKQPIQTV